MTESSKQFATSRANSFEKDILDSHTEDEYQTAVDALIAGAKQLEMELDGLRAMYRAAVTLAEDAIPSETGKLAALGCGPTDNVPDPAAAMGKLFGKMDQRDMDTLNWIITGRANALLDASRSATRRSIQWIPVGERLPDVKLGDEAQFWVCAQRKHNGKRYVFSLWYVNKPAMQANGEPADWAVECELDDNYDAVGWFQIGPSEAYDEYYQPADTENEIVAWMPMTKPEAP